MKQIFLKAYRGFLIIKVKKNGNKVLCTLALIVFMQAYAAVSCLGKIKRDPGKAVIPIIKKAWD